MKKLWPVAWNQKFSSERKKIEKMPMKKRKNEKEMHFFFRNCHFYDFYWHVSMFSLYYNISKKKFKLTVTVFHLGMWYLGWEDLLPQENRNFWFFFKIPFFTVSGVNFRFLKYFQYNFGNYWDIHGMRPIILGYFFQQLRCE